METFNELWESVTTLNSIPIEVYSEINILTGANDRFLKVLHELETTTDFNIRSQIALRYLKENGGLMEINYDVLGK